MRVNIIRFRPSFNFAVFCKRWDCLSTIGFLLYRRYFIFFSKEILHMKIFSYWWSFIRLYSPNTSPIKVNFIFHRNSWWNRISLHHHLWRLLSRMKFRPYSFSLIKTFLSGKSLLNPQIPRQLLILFLKLCSLIRLWIRLLRSNLWSDWHISIMDCCLRSLRLHAVSWSFLCGYCQVSYAWLAALEGCHEIFTLSHIAQPIIFIIRLSGSNKLQSLDPITFTLRLWL